MISSDWMIQPDRATSSHISSTDLRVRYSIAIAMMERATITAW